MRIINATIVILVILAIFIPEITLASGLIAEETKVDLQIHSVGILDSGVSVENNSALLPFDPHNFNNVKIPEKIIDPERAQILDKYAEKIRVAKFPKGKFAINASAYTAAADECGKSDGITASGLTVKEEETIACPPQFPLGTKLHIEGMGTYVCQDRGGAIKGNHIDIYMKTKKQAFAFGRQHLLAEVVQ